MSEKTIDQAMRDFGREIGDSMKLPELVDWLQKKIDLFQAERNIRKSFKKARKVVNSEAFKKDSRVEGLEKGNNK